MKLEANSRVATLGWWIFSSPCGAFKVPGDGSLRLDTTLEVGAQEACTAGTDFVPRNHTVCARSLIQGQCPGDSGNPLLGLHTEGNRVNYGSPRNDLVLGVTSAGLACGQDRNMHADMYTLVSDFRPWIESVIRNEVNETRKNEVGIKHGENDSTQNCGRKSWVYIKPADQYMLVGVWQTLLGVLFMKMVKIGVQNGAMVATGLVDLFLRFISIGKMIEFSDGAMFLRLFGDIAGALCATHIAKTLIFMVAASRLWKFCSAICRMPGFEDFGLPNHPFSSKLLSKLLWNVGIRCLLFPNYYIKVAIAVLPKGEDFGRIWRVSSQHFDRTDCVHEGSIHKMHAVFFHRKPTEEETYYMLLRLKGLEAVDCIKFARVLENMDIVLNSGRVEGRLRNVLEHKKATIARAVLMDFQERNTGMDRTTEEIMANADPDLIKALVAMRHPHSLSAIDFRSCTTAFAIAFYTVFTLWCTSAKPVHDFFVVLSNVWEVCSKPIDNFIPLFMAPFGLYTVVLLEPIVSGMLEIFAGGGHAVIESGRIGMWILCTRWRQQVRYKFGDPETFWLEEALLILGAICLNWYERSKLSQTGVKILDDAIAEAESEGAANAAVADAVRRLGPNAKAVACAWIQMAGLSVDRWVRESQGEAAAPATVEEWASRRWVGCLNLILFFNVRMEPRYQRVMRSSAAATASRGSPEAVGETLRRARELWSESLRANAESHFDDLVALVDRNRRYFSDRGFPPWDGWGM